MATNSILARLLIKISGDTSELFKSLAGSQNKINSFIKDLTNLGKAAGVAFGAFQAASAIKAAIGIIADFEHTMSEVKAITGATGEEFEKLEQDALRLGAATKFTATEVGQLQIAYGRLGFTTKEIIDATEATLNLAAATGEDLAKSADVAGSTVRGFGLKAKETQRVVDVMASSFNKTALGLENFTEAMKFVAPIANAAGASVEETTALLGVLADAGIRGSIAGTSLRKIFTDIAKDGRPLSERLEELGKKGITLHDAFDEVGRTAQTSLLILAKNTDKTRELSAAFSDASGEAAKMARVMQDDLIGDVDKLSSAWEGLLLKLGNTSVFRHVTEIATTMLNALQGNVSEDDMFKVLVTAIRENSEPAIAQFIKDLQEARKEAGKPFDTNVVEFLTEKYKLTEKQSNRLFQSILEVNEALSFQESVIKSFKESNIVQKYGQTKEAVELYKQSLYDLILAQQIQIESNKEADAALGGTAFSEQTEKAQNTILNARRTIKILNELAADFEDGQETIIAATDKSVLSLKAYRDILKSLNEQFDATDVNDKTRLRNLAAQIAGTEEIIARLEKLKSIGGFESILKPLTGEGLVGKNINAIKDSLTGALHDTAGIFEQSTARMEAGISKLAATSKAKTTEIKEAFVDFRGVVSSAIGGIAAAFGSAVGGGEKFGKALLGVIGGILVQLGGMLITAGLGVEAFKTSLKTLQGIPAIVVGAALVAIGSAVSSGIRNLGSSGAASSTGSTSSSASSSATRFSSSSEAQDVKLSLDGVIRGQDLYVILQNYQNSNKFTKANG